MKYLWIKDDNSKVFKSFLSGNEIEVGIYVAASTDVAKPDNEIEIFYGEETHDTYRAEVLRHRIFPSPKNTGKSLLTMSLVKR